MTDDEYGPTPMTDNEFSSFCQAVTASNYDDAVELVNSVSDELTVKQMSVIDDILAKLRMLLT